MRFQEASKEVSKRLPRRFPRGLGTNWFLGFKKLPGFKEASKNLQGGIQESSRSIGFLEASRGFKEASKNLQEASWRLQEASKRLPRGFKRLQEASKRLQEASKRLQEASRGLKRLQEAFKSKSDAQARRIRGIGPFLLQIHCVLQSLFDGASNPLQKWGGDVAPVQPGATRQSLPSHSGEAP